ncbi:hypothetical protein ACQ4WX_02285 [Streptomyces lasalocidi]
MAGVGGVVGLLAGGGARGTVGEAGAWWAVRSIGTARRAATAQVAPAPTAARRRRRRAAPRRISSYRPGAGRGARRAGA